MADPAFSTLGRLNVTGLRLGSLVASTAPIGDTLTIRTKVSDVAAAWLQIRYRRRPLAVAGGKELGRRRVGIWSAARLIQLVQSKRLLVSPSWTDFSKFGGQFADLSGDNIIEARRSSDVVHLGAVVAGNSLLFGLRGV